MSDTKPSRKDSTKQVSIVLDKNLYDALDEYHWKARKAVSTVIVDAVREHAAKYGYAPQPELPSKGK